MMMLLPPALSASPVATRSSGTNDERIGLHTALGEMLACVYLVWLVCNKYFTVSHTVVFLFSLCLRAPTFVGPFRRSSNLATSPGAKYSRCKVACCIFRCPCHLLSYLLAQLGGIATLCFVGSRLQKLYGAVFPSRSSTFSAATANKKKHCVEYFICDICWSSYSSPF